MIIDQLPSLPSVQDTDEIAIERGTTTYKTTVEKLSDEIAQTGGVLTALGSKQDTLVSGTNIKTVGGQSLLGSGNVDVGGGLYFTSVAVSATTGDFASISNSKITANHDVAECVFANPSAITSNVTWTTSAGSLVLNGTCTAATTVNIVLVKKNN